MFPTHLCLDFHLHRSTSKMTQPKKDINKNKYIKLNKQNKTIVLDSCSIDATQQWCCGTPAMPHTISEYNLETYSPRDHRLQSTPVANSSSDCITSTLWFILGFFSHSDTLLDFVQLGSQSRSRWHYQFCSMVYSQEEFRKYQKWCARWPGQCLLRFAKKQIRSCPPQPPPASLPAK